MWFILIVLLIQFAAIFVPVLSKAIIFFDYVMIGVIAFGTLFTEVGLFVETGLLHRFELHTVFIILIMLVILGAYFGIQQIEIFDIKPGKSSNSSDFNSIHAFFRIRKNHISSQPS